MEVALKHRTQRLVAVSERERLLGRRLPGRRVASSVVHQAADGKFAELRCPQSVQPLFVSGVGRVQRQKGIQFFADAARFSKELNLDIVWQWIGGGEAKDEDVLRASGVEVTGWTTREVALQKLRQSSAYVHSAEWEGFPLTIVEATALGLPVFARQIPALTQLVPFAFESSVALVRGLQSFVLGDSEVSEQMERNWSVVSDACTRESQRNALLSAYNDVALRRSSSRKRVSL